MFKGFRILLSRLPRFVSSSDASFERSFLVIPVFVDGIDRNPKPVSNFVFCKPFILEIEDFFLDCAFAALRAVVRTMSGLPALLAMPDALTSLFNLGFGFRFNIGGSSVT